MRYVCARDEVVDDEDAPLEIRVREAAIPEQRWFAQNRAAEIVQKAVLGEIEFRGKLPVELPGFYPIGHSAAKR